MTAKLKYAGRGVDPCACLKLPENIAIAGIERDEAPVVAAGEHQVACRGRRAAVAAVLPALPPDDFIGGNVDGGKDSVERDVRKAEQSLGVAGAGLGLLGSADPKPAHLIVRANKEITLALVVRARRTNITTPP